VLGVIVLFEGEPFSLSEAEWCGLGFYYGCLYFAVLSFPSTLTSPPGPFAEKHPHSMMLLSPLSNVGTVLRRWQTVPGFLHTWCLELRFITPENLVSHRESPLGAFFWCKSQLGFHTSSLRRGLSLATLP